MNIVRPEFPALNDFKYNLEEMLKSGNVTNNGPYVQQFESALTDYLGSPTIVFSSGQAALMTMLAASGVKGGEVICPSFTFCATPHAVVWAGGKPVFTDIDETLCLDPEKIHIRPNTSAILGVNPYGIRCDSEKLSKFGVPFLIDSAPSFGSKLLGSVKDKFCTARIFSFHATKPFSTMEGGALCSNDPELLERARHIRNFGQDAHGECEVPGINGKMLEVCALVGLHQLVKWEHSSSQRMLNAAMLADELSDIEGLEIVGEPRGQSSIWTYLPILIDAEKFGMSRDDVIYDLGKQNITARKYYLPAHRMTAYNRLKSYLPVTDDIASRVVSLPVFNNMIKSEIDHIADSIRDLHG